MMDAMVKRRGQDYFYSFTESTIKETRNAHAGRLHLGCDVFKTLLKKIKVLLMFTIMVSEA